MSKPHFSKLKNPLFKLKTHKTAALLFRVGSFSRAGIADPMKIGRREEREQMILRSRSPLSNTNDVNM